MTKEKITRSELKEKRTANRKVFENQDHSRTVEIYMEPVHYEDEDGISRWIHRKKYWRNGKQKILQ